MKVEIRVVNHADPVHLEWLRQAWGWALAHPDRYLSDGAYKSETEFLDCPPGAIEWAVFWRDELQALVTARPGDSLGAIRAGVMTRDKPHMGVVMRALREIERVLFQTALEIYVILPEGPAFDPARKLAKAVAYRQVYPERWMKWFYESR
jgi:hypothetical protein